MAKNSLFVKISSCLLFVFMLNSCSFNLPDAVSKTVHSFFGNLRGSMMYKQSQDDQKILKEAFEQLIAALESEDADAVRNLFSKSIADKTEGFDESIEELIAFYRGKFVSYDDEFPVKSSKSRTDGITIKYSDGSFDLETDEDKYRIAIRAYLVDDTDYDNIGISSLSIIRAEDCPYKKCSYWGDGDFSPGIHFNKINEDPVETWDSENE